MKEISFINDEKSQYSGNNEQVAQLLDNLRSESGFDLNSSNSNKLEPATLPNTSLDKIKPGLFKLEPLVQNSEKETTAPEGNNDFLDLVKREFEGSGDQKQADKPETNTPPNNLPGFGTTESAPKPVAPDRPEVKKKPAEQTEPESRYLTHDEFEPDTTSLRQLKKGMPIGEATTLSAVHDFLKDNFNRFDKNDDRLVTRSELSEGISEVGSEETRQALTEIFEDYGFNTSVGLKHDGAISSIHVNQFKLKLDNYKSFRARQKSLIPDYYDMANYGVANFESIDTNKDELITRSELSKALEKTSDDKSRRNIQGLLDNFRYVAHGPVGLPRSRYSSIFDRNITREKLYDFVDQQYGGKYEKEHGIIANFKLSKG